MAKIGMRELLSCFTPIWEMLGRVNKEGYVVPDTSEQAQCLPPLPYQTSAMTMVDRDCL